MKVGILQFFGWRDRSVPLNSVYEAALERFSIMDTTGYDAVWLAEHHFSSFSVCPSVHMPICAHDGHHGGGAHQKTADWTM